MEYEVFLSNKDICEMRDCSPSTATRLLKKIRGLYKIDDNRLPRPGCIPKSVYDDFSAPQPVKRAAKIKLDETSKASKNE